MKTMLSTLLLMACMVISGQDNIPQKISETVKKQQEGDYFGAILGWNDIVAAQPENATHWMNRGICKYYAKGYEDAIKDLNKALSLRNNLTEALYFRAQSYLSLKKFSESIDDISNILELSPDYNKHGNMYTLRGILYLEMEDSYKGCMDLRKAMDQKDDEATELFRERCQ